MEAIDKDYSVIIGGDVNLSIGIGQRRDALQELCSMYDLNICNITLSADHQDAWTFRSSYGSLRRLDYLLSSQALRFNSVAASSRLDLGSDHRCVQGRFHFFRSKDDWKNRKFKSFKGWRPTMDENNQPSSYQKHMEKLMNEIPHASLSDLSHICIAAAERGGEIDRGPKGLTRPEDSDELKQLMQERRRCSSAIDRKRLSKAIQRLARRELRAWKAKWTEYLLEKKTQKYEVLTKGKDRFSEVQCVFN